MRREDVFDAAVTVTKAVGTAAVGICRNGSRSRGNFEVFSTSNEALVKLYGGIGTGWAEVGHVGTVVGSERNIEPEDILGTPEDIADTANAGEVGENTVDTEGDDDSPEERTGAGLVEK